MNLRTVKRRGHDDNVETARDEGFSLVEVVITILLIGIVVIPLIMASATSVTASSRTREAAETETVLQNAADRLNRAPAQCDYTLYIEAALKAKQWDPAQVSASYEYYQPGDSVLAGQEGDWMPGACPGQDPPTDGPGGTRPAMLIQRVTITIASPSRLVQQEIRVIKNDV